MDDTSSLPAPERLLAAFHGYGRTLVAFSGGVDSSVVLAGAARALGADRVAALTAVSPSLPGVELAAAQQFCAELGVVHRAVATDELAEPGYRENGPQRCYFCKRTLLTEAVALAAAEGFDVIATGTNASDLAAGFRPGIRAAAEQGARTPLADAGLDKAAVRRIAHGWGLPTWDKPAAACLSSRIAYGVSVTPARLARVERAESAVRALLARHGVRNLRVRDLGEAVRLEVDAEAVPVARAESAVAMAVAAAGFGAAPLVVEPFRSGSMNELLPDPDRWR
ncbi:ATP-dependent sacrificial sulfur transferase LarE [Natronosporangium hydrolyticum]|uniref:ATP-dependent sacrificial sulfur transferase LarE n=1 Tax=Natronosporangium hydrolyticum TaxID=2811111 RepID=A0A895YF91_9ACTN|nr:ATP-dependent sacrificial sulfur transferase LarE [Natronosporangium hydrolyticum]QSB14785.1 ATP-dependent sacrificial sulfur transferase LarE [Natronosporangium hydrolyticum]